MRPKLLEIEGLQSFTDVQRIDFEALGETGIFGIFGPTGSGKSTILDAITFALYGRVKRAENGTQGIIHLNRNTVRVSFTFELSRDGSRRLYRVERTYQRKKNSPNSCEPKIARLIEITGAGEVPLCDKATEVSAYIRELLGLGSEDFTRAVVLPQNSFQEFLLLSNSERRGMLERIFYLEEYGKQLLDKLGRKMARLRSRLDVLSGELMGYTDASDEALEAARKAMDEAFAERSRVEKGLKQSETQFNEARDVWGLECELSDFLRKEQELSASKELFAGKKLQLEKAVKADSLLEPIQKNRELGKRLNDTQKQLIDVSAALPGMADELAGMRRKVESLKKEAASEQPKLVERRTRLVDAFSIESEVAVIYGKLDELQTSINSLNHAISDKSGLLQQETTGLDMLGKETTRLKQEMEPLKIDPEYRQHVLDGVKLENDMKTLLANVNELESRSAELKSSAGVLQQKQREIGASIGSVQTALDELAAENRKHSESKPGDRNAILKGVERIHAVQGLYQLLKLRKNELGQMKDRLDQLQEKLVGMARQAVILEKAQEGTLAAYDRCRLELDEASREMEKNTAFLLSKHLEEGDPCPVCGSTNHPMPAAHIGELDTTGLEHKLEAVRDRLADAEKAFKSAEKETIAVSEQIRTLTEQNSQLTRDFEQKTAEYEEEKQKLPEKLKGLELEQIRQEVEKAATSYAEKLEAVEVWEMKQGEFRDSLKKLEDILSGHKLVENGIVTEQKLNLGNIRELENSLAGAKKLLDEAKRKHTVFLQQYAIESADSEIKRFADNDRKLHQLQKEAQLAQEAESVKRTLADKLKEELRLLNADRIKLEAGQAGLNGQKLEKEAKLKELAGEAADVDGEIKRIGARLDEYVKLETEYLERLQEIEGQYNAQVNSKTLLESQRDIYSVNLRADEMRLKSSIEEKGFTDAAEVESSLLSAELQKEIKTGLDEYEQTLINILAQKEMVRKKLKTRTITEEEWNRINSMHTELIAYVQECISRSEVAKSTYDMLKSKHDRWVELGRGYTELSRRQGLLEQIQKILKAEHRKDNSFIDYIAEERLRYVAAKASETIGIMTKYKYALELDTEAGFIIRDNANGGTHRMVTSLSGGETFLTSLSLALALSEQIQLKGQSPLEFFFLDEGFGTLDSELLDTVIDSLERLSSRERVIGLISHVPELRSRIGRRLVVEPPALQNEGSRVYIDRA